MTLPASGAISFNAINVELGQAGTTTANINQPSYRTLAGVPSGTISLGNFYGKSNRVAISLTASGNNYDVFANRGGSYVAGTSDLTVTVPGTVGSANTGSYAMLVPSGFNPGDTVIIVNNGLIQGAGGAGGPGSNGVPNISPGTPGSGGGSAVYVNRPVTIQNNGTIASGGGGGGGGSGHFTTTPGKPPVATYFGGGGGGGGAGTVGGGGGAAGSGSPVQAGAGGGGTSGGGGGGGVGGGNTTAGPGGAGGGRGAGGAAGAPRNQPGGSGGGTGNYIVGNGFVTWSATGTRQGGVG